MSPGGEFRPSLACVDHGVFYTIIYREGNVSVTQHTPLQIYIYNRVQLKRRIFFFSADLLSTYREFTVIDGGDTASVLCASRFEYGRRRRIPSRGSFFHDNDVA